MRRLGAMVRRVLGLVVCAAVRYGVMPAVLAVFDSWPEVVDIKPYWCVAMVASHEARMPVAAASVLRRCGRGRESREPRANCAG
jgi:hypothetical protein